MNDGEIPEGDTCGQKPEREELDSVEDALTQSLDAFVPIQRSLAAIDFEAIEAARRAIGGSEAFAELLEAQERIVREFSRSIDFSRIAATYEAFEVGGIAESMAAAESWARSLADSIDLSALSRAFESSSVLDSWAHVSSALLESLRRHTDGVARLAAELTIELPVFDTAGLTAALDRWFPANLRGLDGLDTIATVTLEEGLPLSWVPRRELVILLAEAQGPAARFHLLIEHRDDILEDCDLALEGIDSEWAVECRSAIAAMRAGLEGPAQSHSSNIVDSIVLSLHGRQGRKQTTEFAQKGFDELPIQLAAENLSLRPLFRAFAKWYPDSGTSPPSHFARHATSHAVGQPGVFAPASALVAVMLMRGTRWTASRRSRR